MSTKQDEPRTTLKSNIFGKQESRKERDFFLYKTFNKKTTFGKIIVLKDKVVFLEIISNTDNLSCEKDTRYFNDPPSICQ